MHEANLRNQPFEMNHGLINQGSNRYTSEKHDQRVFGPRRVSIDEHATIFGQNHQGFPVHETTANVRDVPDEHNFQSFDWTNHDFKTQKPPLPMISRKSEFDSF